MAMHLRSSMRRVCDNMERKKNRGLFIRDVALLGMLAATLVVGKEVLVIPNVEIVTLLIILYTLQFGRKTVYAVLAFVVLECFFWGIGIWTIMYLYTWPILFILTYSFRKIDSVWFWSILAGIFGMMFGVFTSFVYLVTGGFQTAFIWWIGGIPWDMVHGVSNLILVRILYKPLKKMLNKLSASFYTF